MVKNAKKEKKKTKTWKGNEKLQCAIFNRVDRGGLNRNVIFEYLTKFRSEL